MASTGTGDRRRLTALLAGAGLLTACVSVPKHVPVPLELSDAAEIRGIPHARYWGDETPHWMEAQVASTPEELRQLRPGIADKPHAYLAMSGGGANGAFGAGLLAGWTAAGTRPEFTLVTGISTGALIAPFAFLGSDYDHVLEEAYTEYETRDLTNPRNKINAITSDAAANTKGLLELIERYVDDEMIAKIAAEHRRGRSLLVGTTNLDAERPVIWRLGAIADSGHPQAADLVRRVILASASIPVAFPPVSIPVEAGGATYDELHVDGGVTWQVFVYPASLDFREIVDKLGVQGTPRLYVIRNSKMQPSEGDLRRRLIPIASSSLSSLIRTQGIGDLYRIYTLTERDGLDFNLAYIPDDFDRVAAEPFDREYMRELFDLGYELGKAGYDWMKEPPQLREKPGG